MSEECKKISLIPRSQWLPLFNPRRVDDQWLLTNRIGDWVLLTDQEYADVISVFTPENLLQRLAERRLILFVNGPTSNELLQAWARYNTGLFEGPYLHIIHLTQRCNLGCSYCHSAAIPVTAKGRDLLPEKADQIADFISRVPTSRISINFQGGEPTLMPDLIERIMIRLETACKSRQIPLHASITTNGTLIDSRLIAIFRRFAISTTISLDGPQDVHDSIRQYSDGSGSYADAVEGRNRLLNDGNLDSRGVILVLTRHSVDRIEEIINHSVDLGQRVINLKPVTKLGRGVANWNDLAISFEEFWDTYVRALSYMATLQQQGIWICELSLIMALRKIIEGRNTTYVDFRNPCGLVHGVLNYDIDGKIYGCHEGKRKKEFLIGMVSDDPVEVLNSAKAKTLSSASVLDQHAICRSCAYIAYCGPCPAHNYQAYGDTAVRPLEDWHCRFTLALNDFIFREFQTRPEVLLGWWRYSKLTKILSNGS